MNLLLKDFPHHRIGMLLAGILSLCVLLGVPVAGRARGIADCASTVVGCTVNPIQQTSAPQPSTQQTSAQQPTAQTESSSPQTPSTQTSSPSSSKPASAQKPKPKKKPAQSAPTSSDTPPKKVVKHGGTENPTTHLAPSMTDEQTAKSRAANNESINAAASNLQRVEGRSLTPEQKETEEQIRKFMEQSKAADEEGDLQRAGTLANKAKLLSDSLEETSRPK